MNHIFEIETRGPGLYEFTPDLSAWLATLPPRDGLLTLLVRFGSRRRVVRESTRYFRPRRKKEK